MTIKFHNKSKEFHLYNEEVSYIIKILKNNQLGHLYYGKKIRDRESFEHLLELKPRAMSVCTFEGDLDFSLEHIKQEYPAYGSGDMRYPAYEIVQKNGSNITCFEYVDHKIYNGKPKLSGLPATYAENNDECTTLEIKLRDKLINVDIILIYTIFENYPVIARSTKFISNNEEGITLNSAMSVSVDLPNSDYEMMELTGAWSRERSVRFRKLEHGIQSIYSMKGCSSNSYNPFIALKEYNANEFNGEVYGFSLVYSGNFLAQIDVDTFDVSRITLGINPNCFKWDMIKGEEFQTPEVVMVYSDKGLNYMSQTYHNLYRTRLARGYWRDKVRPILINNWEATYFDFDEEKILDIAKTAKELGVELFVLDDGWFGRRNNDLSSLGDWYVDYNKLPNGIKGISEKIDDIGLMFGLWFEPEMINKDSDLYRKHPEWVLSTPGRNLSHGRNQFILDFSKEEVIDYIYNMMEKVLTEGKISYVKWDMNRCMSEVFSQNMDASYQGKVMHRYILGVYKLYDKLIKKFPNILFESCASGGARFDPGLLYYAPQCWASDNTDAIERLKIQYGTTMVYPLSSIGAHVSAIPNHQMLRNTPIDTRANVAYFGTFGYELDLNKLSSVEKEKVSNQIKFMKKYRELILNGTFYRLESPFEGNTTAWMVISKDKKEALVGYYRTLQLVNSSYKKIKLKGLDENLKYSVSINNNEVYGDELMNFGLIVSDESSGENKETYDGTNGDYQSRIYVLKSV